jgi:hypothetical protein
MLTLNRIISLILISILPLSFTTLTSCKDCDCTEATFDVFDKKDIRDNREDSPFNQQLVAVYHFTQTTTLSIPENADCDCDTTKNVTRLSIENKTDKTLKINNYSVYFTYDKFQWVYRSSGITRIAPKTTLEVGEISTDDTNISRGYFTMFIELPEYED